MTRSILRGAYFHDFDFEHEHVDPNGDAEGVGGEDDIPGGWELDNVELVTVGVDIGSSTSHLLFARLHLQRLAQSLSSRFVVVERKVLHRTPILLTPYRADGLIDVDQLEQFVNQAYKDAGLAPDDVDTGAVILTGAALERANARAVAELFAAHGGKFVTASAGHNLESILAAHGSGAVALSHARPGELLLHVDIGGGTSKLSLIRDAEVLQTAAVGVGGRLVAFDDQDRVTRIEHVAQSVADELGIRLALGEVLAPADRVRIAERLVDVLLRAIGVAEPDALTREMMLTEPLSFAEGKPRGMTFSGGVSEYVYARETTRYGDLAVDLADTLRGALRDQRVPYDVLVLEEGIRATVIGASQFSVQLSGNTLHISNPDVLPLQNLPVVYARLPAQSNGHAVDAETVREAIEQGFRRMDITEGEKPVAVALPWRGEPRYGALRMLADGIASAMPRSVAGHFPLVLALESDIGRSLGGILAEDMGLPVDVLAIDGLNLRELDYVDVGEMLQPSQVVPVIIKSLAFPSPSK